MLVACLLNINVVEYTSRICCVIIYTCMLSVVHLHRNHTPMPWHFRKLHISACFLGVKHDVLNGTLEFSNNIKLSIANLAHCAKRTDWINAVGSSHSQLMAIIYFNGHQRQYIYKIGWPVVMFLFIYKQQNFDIKYLASIE